MHTTARAACHREGGRQCPTPKGGSSTRRPSARLTNAAVAESSDEPAMLGFTRTTASLLGFAVWFVFGVQSSATDTLSPTGWACGPSCGCGGFEPSR